MQIPFDLLLRRSILGRQECFLVARMPGTFISASLSAAARAAPVRAVAVRRACSGAAHSLCWRNQQGHASRSARANGEVGGLLARTSPAKTSKFERPETVLKAM